MAELLTAFDPGGDKLPAWQRPRVTFELITAGIPYSPWKTKGAEEEDWPAQPNAGGHEYSSTRQENVP